VHCNGLKLCFILSIKFNKLVSVSLFLYVVVSIRIRAPRFSCFSTGFFHHYAISSAILTVVATHLALTQLSLVVLCHDIGKRTIRLGLWPWDIQLLGVGQHGPYI
jgi:hypothetical protein